MSEFEILKIKEPKTIMEIKHNLLLEMVINGEIPPKGLVLQYLDEEN